MAKRKIRSSIEAATDPDDVWEKPAIQATLATAVYWSDYGDIVIGQREDHMSDPKEIILPPDRVPALIAALNAALDANKP